MGMLLLSVALIVAVSLAARGLVYVLGRRRSLRRAYRQLAENRRGLCLGGGLLRPPSVVFTHDGAEASVAARGVDDRLTSKQTRLTIAWPDPAIRCTIEPHTLATRLQSLFGTGGGKNILPAFQRSFVAQVEPVNRTGELLTAGLQSSILKLAAAQARGDVRVVIDGGKLTVRVRRVIRDADLLERFTSLALQVYDEALLGRSAGIEVVAHCMDAASGDACCPVCGEAICSDLVYCASCTTAHHGECWRYVGACSTYACGGKHFRAGAAAASKTRTAAWRRPTQPR